jgi:hypothetical protein
MPNVEQGRVVSMTAAIHPIPKATDPLRRPSATSQREEAMKLTARIMTVVAALAISASLASANPATPRVDRREVRQQSRIAQGAHDGQLNRREVRSLKAGQRHIRRMERRAKADGKVTRAERRHLNRAQNRQSRHIYRLKHNAKTR